MAGRVFVVQNPHGLDRASGQLVPKYDFSPAERFGRLEFLLSPTASPWGLGTIIPELREKLGDFDDDDRLLLSGNPALIGIAFALAAEANYGRVTMLQWNGKFQEYREIEADITA